MSRVFRLIFVDENAQKVEYDLTAETLVPASSDAPSNTSDCEKIAILPGSAALPFEVALPFSDPEKIARVLPQFVADLYVDVDETWHFSWKALKSEQGEAGCLVVGLTLPPQFAPAMLAGDDEFRLMLPDLLLVDARPGMAARVKTPVCETIAIFSEARAVRRVLPLSAGLPEDMLLAAEGVEVLEEVDLTAAAPVLHRQIESLLASDCGSLDISGFSRARRRSLRSLLALSAAVIAFLWFMSWHLFVWLECRITEGAAQRTRAHMQQAFSATFPGTPVVEPLTQTSRSIMELEKRLKEATLMPKLPWLRVLRLVSMVGVSDGTFQRLTARENGFRCNGTARDYAALERLRSLFTDSGIFERVNIAESRQADDGIMFSLEAPWKK